MTQFTKKNLPTARPSGCARTTIPASVGANRHDARRPWQSHAHKKVRGQWRLFAAPSPTMWDVGVRSAAPMRTAYAAQAAESTDQITIWRDTHAH